MMNSIINKKHFEKQPKNFILMTLDCVRQEAIGCYSKRFPFWKTFPARAKTPNIDELAKDGVIFTEAFCQVPFTPASHASIMTGLNPYHHGLRGMFSHKLSPSVRTLAELLGENGYRTAAFIGSHALSSEYGLNRGFEVYDENFRLKIKNAIFGYRRPGWEITDKALEWLTQQEDAFFLFLHYFDAHDIAQSSKMERRRRVFKRWVYKHFFLRVDQRIGKPLFRLRRFWKSFAMRKTYGMAYQLRKTQEIDVQIGRIMNFLKQRSLYDNTIIVITADHGDSFGEHGEFSHREYLYDTTIKIPLIFKGRHDIAGRSVSHLVRSIDIYPTILDMLGIVHGSIDGVNLFKLMRGEFQQDLNSYAETRYETATGDIKSHLISLRTSEWKFIINLLKNTKELYEDRFKGV
jgi:arylsulfatase A-like enzyme